MHRSEDEFVRTQKVKLVLAAMLLLLLATLRDWGR